MLLILDKINYENLTNCSKLDIGRVEIDIIYNPQDRMV